MIAPRAAAIWRHRLAIEGEAAGHFGWLAGRFAAGGDHDLAARARQAAADERDHATRCQAVIAALGGDPTPPAATPLPALGATDRPAADHALYAAVAVGCVTESLSCALLLALRAVATHPQVVATLDAIAKDEIAHARLGWAALARAAARADVGWLGAHVDGMRAAAVGAEVAAVAGDDALAELGVLPRAEAAAVVAATWATVIVPGLARHGVVPGASAAAARASAGR